MNKIPPPFIAAGNIVLLYLSTLLIPSFEFTGQKILGILIGLEGVIIIFVSIRLFRKYQTTINPFKAHETSRLITSGIYSFTRNPMYLGLSSIQVAFGIYLGAHVSIFLIPCFIIYITNKQIIYEEEILKKEFRDEYLNYLKSVRRWI
ncbi:MAG: membrane protein [Burkholderiaceae bacterium]|nr:MAG: membrane protein [Burkholderiaceae bacterium]